MLGTLSANANGDAIICYAIGWSKDTATTKGFNESFKDNDNYNLEGSTVTSEKGKAYKNGEEGSLAVVERKFIYGCLLPQIYRFRLK